MDKQKITAEAYNYYSKNIEPLKEIEINDHNILSVFRNGEWMMCGHNDAVDAFRHAYVSAVFTYEYGNKTAYLLGLGNEVNGWLDNQPSSERRMEILCKKK